MFGFEGRYSGWQKIEIDECGEELVSVTGIDSRIRVEPIYYKLGYKGACNDIFLRQTVCDMLIKALEYLPEKCGLVIWDGWRSYETQMDLYKKFEREIAEKYKEIGEEELVERVTQFVSLPSIDQLKPSPHITGGAVDLTLETLNCELLSMGTDFDDFSEKAKTGFYEEQGIGSPENENRKLMYNALTAVGFTNYSSEWWHYDYGNQFWASATGRKAIYGLINYKE